MPFPEYVMLRCVWFIGVWFVVLIRSCWIGFADVSIADGEEGVVVLVDDDVLVVVVLLVVVVAATGVVTILSAIIIITASVKMVAKAVAMTLLSPLLLRRCIISLASQHEYKQ